MNSILSSTVRVIGLVTTLVFPVALAARNPAPVNRTAQLLAIHGALPVSGAGPYVERGTFQIQVTAKLGEPTERLADGTWLYKNFSTEQNAATGTLIVRFNQAGRVSDLWLATPAVIADLRSSRNPAGASALATAQARR